jgi:hypothetical protein
LVFFVMDRHGRRSVESRDPSRFKFSIVGHREYNIEIGVN